MSATPLPPDVEAIARAAGLEDRALHRLAGLGLTGVSDLDLLARTHRLRDDPDVGPDAERRLLAGLLRGQGWGPRRLLDAARSAASRLLSALQREPSALRLAVAGALRRMDPVVDGVDLVATSHDPEALLAAFTALPGAEEVVGGGPGWREVRLADGLRARLAAGREDAEALAALLVRTGPATYVEALQERARARGLRLAEDGLHREGGLLPLVSEEEICEHLGLPFHPPEVRGALAPEDPPPSDLVRMTDLRGVFHVHTRRGHGAHGLPDLLARAAREGYSWLAVTDRARPAGGPPLTPDDVASAREEGQRARRLAEASEDLRPIDLLVGAEVAVLPDGTLDAPEDLLASVDLVVVVADAPDGVDVTQRLRTALGHPRVRVLGRPEGRVLLGRPGPRVDVPAVLEACATHGVAVELNGDPHRLTLDPRWHREAQRLGVRALVGADAHDLAGIDQAILGVGCARRGLWRRDDVLNTRDAAAFRAWCGERIACPPSGRKERS